MFAHSLDLCSAERIGARGLPPLATLSEFTKAERALDFLRESHRTGSLALLQVPFREDDLKDIQAAADRLTSGASDIVFLGTGGSSLGGQAVAQLADWNVAGAGAFRKGPRLHFLDNLDPLTFGEVLAKLPLEGARFVIISKSGGTAETLMQTLALIEHLRKSGREKAIYSQLLGITEPENWKSNPLRRLLANLSVPMLEHDTKIGGRYSALTNVGLLPAAIAGLDIKAIRAGARSILEPILNGAHVEGVPAAQGGAAMIAFAGRGLPMSVMMAYADRLDKFTSWYVQLWAESLGKNGKGTTPVRALGPVDQHSQLQLFLDGPADKVFTLITIDNKGQGPRIGKNIAKQAGLEELADKTIGDLVAAQGQASAETLAKRGRPVRQIHIPKLDEQAIGALMMHFFLETIISAQLLEIDAFDQPAVEEGKLLAKAYLRQG